MDTLRHPRIRMPSLRLREIVADALLSVGFVLMVLGIYEVGGLFNLGVGFAAFADMRRLSRDEEEAFLRITDDL